MKVGFIGAGKVGFSLGRYLAACGIGVSGYYSRNPDSAREAAQFTGTLAYETVRALAESCEVIFVTVPDDAISSVWEQLVQCEIGGKLICHCSGVLSSHIFSGIDGYRAKGYSLHPLLAVNDRLHSYREFSHCLFTIEGEDAADSGIAGMIRKCGNQLIAIAAEDKIRYHAAAVLGSNLVLGLFECAAEELMKCGFSGEAAREALVPFMQANLSHLSGLAVEECLTGPVERGDLQTVAAHLDTLRGENREIYRLLSARTLGIARRKNPARVYTGMEELLYS